MSQRTAWVTGGGTGIGLGIARALADDGYVVYISGRRKPVLEKAVEAYGAGPGGGSLVPAPTDVAAEDDVAATVDRIRRETGRLDVLVMSAGINVSHRSFADTTAQEWRKLVEVNATGSFLVMKASVPLMKASGNGLIVNVCSLAGLRAHAMAGVAYSASKFASRSLGIFAANELAEEGLRVTNIYPGEVNTPMLDERAEPPTPERRAQMVQPEDVGAVVALIARLPDTTHIPELVIKPRYQEFV